MSGRNEGDLPKGWTEARIEDLFWPLEDGRTLHQGWSPQCEKTPAPTDEDWGVLKTTAIQPGQFLPQHNKNLPKQLTPRPQTEVKVGDFLITCAGPRVRCGVACLVRSTRPRLMMSGKMYRFRVSSDYFDARFLEAYLLTPRARAAIDKMKTGGSDSGLNLTHDRFRPLPIPVAPLNEQERIMDVLEELLSDLDAGVAALERVRVKLKHYRATVLKSAVDGTLTAEWRAQHPVIEPASELLKRILTERRRRWEQVQLQKFSDAGKTPPEHWKAKYKEPPAPDTTNLAPLSARWCWASVGQLAEIGTGATPNRGKKERYYLDGEIPWVTSGCVNAPYVIEPSDYVTKFALQECNLSLYPSGTLLLAMYGEGKTRGKCTELKLASTTNQALAALIVAREAQPYVKLFLLKNYHDTRKAATGGVQPNLNLAMVREIKLPLPPLAEQAVIVEAVDDQLSSIDHLETDLEAKLKSAVALRQSLLRDAFEGKLVPQDPNDEPASELLKRFAIERKRRAREILAAKKSKAKPTTTRGKSAKP